MTKRMERVGYLTAKVCDVEAGMSATNPQQYIPLSFYFTIALDGNILDGKSAMSNIVNMGCVPIALLMRDSESGKFSLWTPAGLPEWMYSVLSDCAPGLIRNSLNSLTGDNDGGSEWWC
ncbi:MAG: hypothetical protein ABSA48_01000 [Terracidiphilus sp.]|jgi:hypothetical protein